MPFKGKLAPNDKLAQAEYIAQNNLIGPETIVFNFDGLMYTGLTNGHIVRVNKDEKVVKIAQMGNEKNASLCGIT
jgi:hypothetical protein